MKILNAKLLLIVVLILSGSCLFAQAPMKMNYQGKLADAGGNPLNGSYNILFKIYDVAENGDALWQETHANVSVTEGLFNVILGETTPFTDNLFSDGGSRYLEISVGAETLMPRYELTSVAYAIHANQADAVAADAIATENIQNGSVTQDKLDAGITALPAGPAGGDLGGTFPNATVQAIRGRGIADTAPTQGQVLKWNSTNSQWEPSVDESGGTLNTAARLTGDGTSGSPLDLAQQGATTDQVLKWNGTAWVPGTDVSGGTVNVTERLTGDGTAGKPLDLAAQNATSGQVLQWNGSAWAPATISVSGGNTLDQAYDQGGAGLGRTITADKGAVNIAGSDGLTVEGAVAAGSFSGNGAGLTGLIATNIASGVLKTSVLDEDLQDLADGSLTGSKVGTGINGSFITSGTVADDRLEQVLDRTVINATDYMTALGGMHIGGVGDPNTDNLWVDGFVGIGTSAVPRYPLEFTNTTSSRGIFIDHNQTSNFTTYAIEVDLDKTDGGSSAGYGIMSRATNTGGTGSVVGVYGSAEGTSTGSKYGVYGYAAGSGTLYAGYFQGDVYVAGKLTNTSSGASLPIAYGVINSDGSVMSSTSNVSCVYNSTSTRYEITISGYSYVYSAYVAAVTPVTSNITVNTSSMSGKLLVYVRNSAGTLAQGIFQFVVYKP